MSPEKQRIAIAEAMPPSLIHFEDGEPMMHLWGDAFTPFDPLNDLNACAEMEKSLKGEQRHQYASELCYTVGNTHVEQFDIITATAPQRCEAFLRAKGLWRDG